METCTHPAVLPGDRFCPDCGADLVGDDKVEVYDGPPRVINCPQCGQVHPWSLSCGRPWAVIEED